MKDVFKHEYLMKEIPNDFKYVMNHYLKLK